MKKMTTTRGRGEGGVEGKKSIITRKTPTTLWCRIFFISYSRIRRIKYIYKTILLRVS